MKKVSVFLITYNHEKYIAKAIEGILSQEVNFDFELVIGEDCSKDNTRAVCEQYASKFPGIIKLLPSDKNYGAIGNTVRTLRACNGTYIALCEGDDYWTDRHKLQKQADFLDANPDFSMCFSDVEIIDEIKVDPLFSLPILHKEEFTMEDIITTGYSFIPTATFFFRNNLPDTLPVFFLNSIGGDIPLQLIMADKGRAKYFREKTAVYRHHPGGATKNERNLKVLDEREFQMFEEAKEYFNPKYSEIFQKHLCQMSKVMLIYGAKNKKGMEKIKHYFKKMPYYLKYSKGINFKELFYYHAILFFPSILKAFSRQKEHI